MPPIRTLIVDDSRSFRLALRRHLRSISEIEVIGEVGEADKTVQTVQQLMPDVVTLDLLMPGINGFEILSQLRRFNVPVIVVSGVPEDRKDLVSAALKRGAFDVIRKPRTAAETPRFVAHLHSRMKAAVSLQSVSAVEQPTEFSVNRMLAPQDRQLIAIGASTGGTKALMAVLTKIPADCPAIVIAQHMMPSMLALFANQLNAACKMTVRLAKTGDVPQRGVALLAPGDRHLALHKKGSRLVYELNQDAKIHGQRPAVDALFLSIAKAAKGFQPVGVILTGMGADGADGLLAMRKSGCITVAEDERDCVVFGMPGAAMKCDAVMHVHRLYNIANFVLEYAKMKSE